MNIPSWCIRNNRTSFFILVLFGLLGLQTYLALPRLENPEFVMRVAMVRTIFPGASPLKVEQLVTDPIEEKLRTIALRSCLRFSLSLLTAEGLQRRR